MLRLPENDVDALKHIGVFTIYKILYIYIYIYICVCVCVCVVYLLVWIKKVLVILMYSNFDLSSI